MISLMAKFRSDAAATRRSAASAGSEKHKNTSNVVIIRFIRLESNLQSKLDHPWIARRCNRTKRGVAKNHVRRAERRSIGKVKYLSPEFQAGSFAQHRPFDQGNIRIAIGGSTHGIPRTVSNGE